jgi:hypothetical protein
LNSKCKLVFIQEIRNQQDIEYLIDSKCVIGDIFETKYYTNANNGLELSKYIKIREHYISEKFKKTKFKTSERVDLRFIEIDNLRYKCEKISSLNGNYIGIDLSEVK